MLTLGALGVVYGDIGTSPLYTLRECLTQAGGFELTPDNVLGVLSLIFWALIVVVTVKYVIFVMRADNQGEGGILALTALALRGMRPGHRRTTAVMAAGIVGAALFYGDCLITPAISVLSAVKGLLTGNPRGLPPGLLHSLKHYKVLHQRVVLLTVEVEDVPHVPDTKRFDLKPYSAGFYRLIIHFGFMDEPNIPGALEGRKIPGLPFEPMETSYSVSRETLIRSRKAGPPPWQEPIFIFLSRLSTSASEVDPPSAGAFHSLYGAQHDRFPVPSVLRIVRARGCHSAPSGFGFRIRAASPAGRPSGLGHGAGRGDYAGP